MSKTNSFIAFIFGAAIGSAATFLCAKKYYERRNQEDIDSVEAMLAKRYSTKSESEEEYVPTDEDIADNADIIDENEYDTRDEYEDDIEDYDCIEMNGSDVPYVITPEEFDEYEEYDKVSLTYYSDMILTDDDDELVEDVESTVGFASLNHFGEYDDNCVFVRNDKLMCDFEILRDNRRYSDVINKRPPRIGS